MDDLNSDSVFQFPSKFPIKVMGRNDDGFVDLVLSLLRLHSPDLSSEAVITRLSRDGNFVSITVNITAENREQLDAIYQELTAEKRVLMAL